MSRHQAAYWRRWGVAGATATLLALCWTGIPRVQASPFGEPGLIAFDAQGDPIVSDYTVRTVRRDGTDQRVLVEGTAPSWSPDGSMVAFDDSGAISVVNADGTGLRRLTSGQHFDGSPAWSPDGSHIAFTRCCDPPGDSDILLVPVAGGAPANISGPEGEIDPAWSPDGRMIAFSSGGIWTMRRDGGGRVRLTATPEPDYDPDWSPDGTTIAFTGTAGSPTSGSWTPTAPTSASSPADSSTTPSRPGPRTAPTSPS